MQARLRKKREQNTSREYLKYIAAESRPYPAYSSPPRPTKRRESSQESSETPSAIATQPTDSTDCMDAAERCGMVSASGGTVGRLIRVNSTAPQQKTPAASRMPGTARIHEKGIGGGAAASSSTRSITEAMKPEEGINSPSVARMWSISLSIRCSRA